MTVLIIILVYIPRIMESQIIKQHHDLFKIRLALIKRIQTNLQYDRPGSGESEQAYGRRGTAGQRTRLALIGVPEPGPFLVFYRVLRARLIRLRAG